MGAAVVGKFRGVVSDVQDPLMQGRIKARVPDVFGDNESGWALPCLAFGGSQMGLFVLPDVGAPVWVEFEHGDPQFPVWVGCWFAAKSDMPSALSSPPYQKTMLVTKAGHSITLDDAQGGGGITLETAGGQKIVLSAQGIEIDNGNGALIKLSGSQVNINNGALEVS